MSPKEKAPPVSRRGFCFLLWGRSDRVVHLVLDRVRRLHEESELFLLQFDVAIDLIVGEDVAFGEELAVRIK